MRFEAAVPIFRIFDEAKAREFYLDYLGFAVDWEHRFDAEAPIYLQISLGGARLHLSEHSEDATPGASARIEVSDLEAYHAALSAKPYKYARPGILSQSWGVDEMKISDSFANSLIFHQDSAV